MRPNAVPGWPAVGSVGVTWVKAVKGIFGSAV
jgi:hypothetical protein